MSMRICGGLLAVGLLCGASATASAGGNFSLFIGGGAPFRHYYAPAPVYGPPVYYGPQYYDYHYGHHPHVYHGYGGHHHRHHGHHGPRHGHGHHHGHHHHW